MADPPNDLAAALQKIGLSGGPTEPPRHKLAHAARDRDVQATNESARAATQVSILINGGAATAILAYLAKGSPTPREIVTTASLAIVFYAIGVLLGAGSMWFSSQASSLFAQRWEAVLDNKEQDEKEWERQGNQLAKLHRRLFIWSSVAFLVASLSAAGGFVWGAFFAAPTGSGVAT